MNTPNSWSPYYTYKDCSQGICSLYCPQWCYIIFPPPPPISHNDHSSSFNFSPLIIAVIAILAIAFLLVTYYAIISRYCRRARRNRDQVSIFESNLVNHDQHHVSSSGLDETTIESITISKYKKGDGSIEGKECSVCLSEFQENEELRLLPKCNHSFHVTCIDTWLKSHSNCPLCRANVIVPINPILPSVENSSSVNVLSLQVHRGNDAVSVVNIDSVSENVIVCVENQLERSNSCRVSLSVADILHIRDDFEDEDSEMGIGQICSSVGSSSSIKGRNSNSPC